MDILKELETRISDDMALSDIADAFFQVCEIPVDTYEEEFIFESGTYAGSFEIHLVRQYEDDEIGEFMNLTLDLSFEASDATNDIISFESQKKYEWFKNSFLSSKEYSLLKNVKPKIISADLSET